MMWVGNNHPPMEVFDVLFGSAIWQADRPRFETESSDRRAALVMSLKEPSLADMKTR